ncbi:MAG: glycosyltransferase, partial [Candidatus Thermoplasmatota archaeon]|nr:glycosyltransferase [Candidatus Thermoplasmatota archaeon]
MKVIYVGQNLLKNKKDMNYGGMIRKYYSQKILSEKENLIFIEKYKDVLKFKENIIDQESFLWIHYPLQRKLSILTIFLSFFFQNKIILTIHDIPILQQKDLADTKYTYFKQFSIKFTEKILFRIAKYIILPAPGLKKNISKRKNQTFFVMPPGISKQELNIAPACSFINKRKVALYFGSMKRSDSIFQLTKVFSKMDSWDLHLVGPLDNEQLHFANNIKYLGQVNHCDLPNILHNSDVILIPYPKTEYFNLCMPIKLGYSLMSFKPIITTKLNGIQEYVNFVR